LTNFPVQHTPFIGYQVELAQIAARLNDPECHLLTLCGPGGVGKSRLAIQAAQLNAGSFADGAVFVPLAALRSDNWMSEAIACAMDNRFGKNNQGSGPGCQEGLNTLQGRALLLILDHYEHLLPSVDLIQQTLKTAPRLKVLVTSRRPLELPAEWVLEIHGLAFPSQDLVPQAHTFDAVRLFAQAAARVQPKFTLSAQTLPAVTRLCRLVLGNPLALEMSAAWLSGYTPSQAAAQIAMELDLLAASRPDLEERQRGTLAVFNKTWERLSVAEQVILQRASVFRGGFDWRAAQAVLAAAEALEDEEPLGAPLDALLGALVEKSLLLEAGQTRFDLQPLVSEYAADRLDADPAKRRRTERRYAVFFTTRLQKLTEESPGKQTAAVEDLHGELDNLRKAWEWAVDHGDILAIERGADGLARFYMLRNRPEEGAAAFQRAVAAIRPLAEAENPGGERQRLLADLVEQLGRFQSLLEKSE
jgi:predicted ATPase